MSNQIYEVGQGLLENLAARKPYTAMYAGGFAIFGSTIGALLWGPKGAAVLGGAGGAVGAYIGAIKDEAISLENKPILEVKR